IGQHRKAVATPNFIFCGFFSICNFSLNLCPVSSVKLTAQRPFNNLTRNAFPCEPEFDLFTEIPPRFSDTPHERPRIEPRRFPPQPCPLSYLLPQCAAAVPLMVRINDHNCESRRVLDRGAVRGKRRNRDARSPFKLLQNKGPHRRLYFCLLIERSAPVTHYFF